MKVLRLPPYQADLNAIELVWGYLKNHLRKMIGSKTKISEISEKVVKFFQKLTTIRQKR